MIETITSNSKLIDRIIPLIYSKGYVVLINTELISFPDWNRNWAKSKIKKLPAGHDLIGTIPEISFGSCILYYSDNIEDAKFVYGLFNKPDMISVSFWENGIKREEK